MKTRHASANRFRFAVRKAALTLAAAMAVAATQLAFAATGPGPAEPLESAVFQLGNSLRFKAVATNTLNSPLRVTLRDAKKQVVHTESLHTAGTYIRTFDLSALADGEYTFEITNGQQSDFKVVHIETTHARIVDVH